MTVTSPAASPSANAARHYAVVMNADAAYSLWPVARAIPDGWSHADFTGSRQECLDHVARVWTDMRPLGLRDEGRGS